MDYEILLCDFEAWAVNDILKQKSEFAHQDNIKEKLALEKVKGRAEEIYAELDNN